MYDGGKSGNVIPLFEQRLDICIQHSDLDDAGDSGAGICKAITLNILVVNGRGGLLSACMVGCPDIRRRAVEGRLHCGGLT